MKKFEINEKYVCRSICDHEAKFYYTAQRRTLKSLWIDGARFKIFLDTNGNEYIYPMGKYSMCLILRA